MNNDSIPINDPENNELLGFVVHAAGSWRAQTMFGYTMEIAPDEATARRIVHERGLSYLTGVWQYFDKDDQQWYPCILNEASQQRVRVTRTSSMGFQDPDMAKTVIITKPDETNLVKN